MLKRGYGPGRREKKKLTSQKKQKKTTKPQNLNYLIMAYKSQNVLRR